MLLTSNMDEAGDFCRHSWGHLELLETEIIDSNPHNLQSRSQEKFVCVTQLVGAQT